MNIAYGAYGENLDITRPVTIVGNANGRSEAFIGAGDGASWERHEHSASRMHQLQHRRHRCHPDSGQQQGRQRARRDEHDHVAVRHP